MAIRATGITVTPTTSSVAYSLPTTSVATRPALRCRIYADGPVFIKVGNGAGLTVTSNDAFLEQYVALDDFDIAGCDHFAVIKPSGSTATIVNVVAIES